MIRTDYAHPELLAPAGSPEALRAAVRAGADAVYLAHGDFNARRGAKNFSAEELEEAVLFCHLRGARLYLTLNTLITDRELPRAIQTAAFAARCGVDALIVQDVGLARLLRILLPDTPLHASTQMTVHNLPGVEFCAALGLRRVVLARELSREAIDALLAASPVELEMFVHGALCMCYSGQCYFSALVGERSGNRGLCAQPCRLPYRNGDSADEAYPLSLKDLCLADEMSQLSKSPIACLKLEGRMKRPEYVAHVTQTYAALLREGRDATEEELTQLAAVFSREGFTKAYYQGRKRTAMLGHRREGERMPDTLLAAAQAIYNGKEAPRVPVTFYCSVRAGEAVSLTVSDPAWHSASVTGPVPEAAHSRPLTAEEVTAQLQKTGGTVYFAETIQLDLDEGLRLPPAAFNALRRAALEALSALRTAPPQRQIGTYTPPPPQTNRCDAPLLHVSLTHFDQLSDALLAAQPQRIYLPPEQIARHADQLKAAIAQYPATCFGVQLPRIVWDHEFVYLKELLTTCHEIGMRDALVGTWGLVALCQELGFTPRGDFGLGVCNGQTLVAMQEIGFASATLSFELNLAQMRDMPKAIDCEILSYGRLPMMLTERCPTGDCEGCAEAAHCQVQDGAATLTDRRKLTFPVQSTFGDRFELLNAKTLFLADRQETYQQIGLWAQRLCFTTEDAATCRAIVARYQGSGEAAPADPTRGLYYRRVE